MSGNQQQRSNRSSSGAQSTKNKNTNRNRGGKRKKKHGGNKSKSSAIDPKRPLWENPAGEAELREIVGSVRPAQNPTAVVRSLGDPPLGKFATNAHHYYEAVYDKAQQYAIAIAAANGLLVIDEEEADDAIVAVNHEADHTDD